MSTSIQQQKQLLRKKFLAERRALNGDGVQKRSKELTSLLINEIDTTKISKAHCFLPIVGDNEPDLRSFITFLVDQGVQVHTSNPPANTVETLLNIELHNFTLDQNVQFDLIIVPMLAYDPATNHRLGFGGGFYDRLLAEQPKAQKIGVCYKKFSTNNIPVEIHDQPLQKIFAV